MPFLPRLAQEIAELQKQFNVEVREDGGMADLVFRDFPIGPGFNLQACDLLIRVPLSYPAAGPDMFWTDPGLVLADGREPQSANIFEVHSGRRWRRFSWHRKAWDGVRDNLWSYLEFVRHRLAQNR
jgi:hypothetical protein